MGSSSSRVDRKRSLSPDPQQSKSMSKPKINIPCNFSFNGSAKELHKNPIYCVAWSSDLYRNTNINEKDQNDGKNNKSSYFRCFATCAGNFVTIYDVANQGRGNFTVRQAYEDADSDEVFYACAFGGRGIQAHVPESMPKDVNESQRMTLSNPVGWTYSTSSSQLLCCGGSRGIIKVIDPLRRALIMTLSGHGDEIYDLKFSPIDEFLLITASKDESLRLWNIRSATCVVMFTGHEGHRDAILSLSFHPLGTSFVSAGMDTSIKIWSLENETVTKAILESSLPSTSSLAATKSFSARLQQMPLYSTNKAHTDYVDCVQYVGDLILSKSITNTILLWKPDLSQARVPDSTVRPPRSANIIPLREFSLSNCECWFIRFHTDDNCRLLSIGNNVGEIKVWDIDGRCEGLQTKKSLTNITHKDCQGKTIRMVAFSPDGDSLVACCDDSSVLMWNAS